MYEALSPGLYTEEFNPSPIGMMGFIDKVDMPIMPTLMGVWRIGLTGV